MTRWKIKPTFVPDSMLIDDALNALKEDELRTFVWDLIPWLDSKAKARLVDDLVSRASKSQTQWAPAGPSPEMVERIIAFSKAARCDSYAEPTIVDEYLRQGSNAFLSKDYKAALQIFRALLIPLSNGDFHIGQEEMVDEMLGISPSDCASQYVVSVYMTAPPERRVKDIAHAIADLDDVGYFSEPLKQIESAAKETLPDFDAFLIQWIDYLRKSAASCGNRTGSRFESQLREAVKRVEGTGGLAEIARASRRGEDLNVWCAELVSAGDWPNALLAYEESASLVSVGSYYQGTFLDGAALAAQVLRQPDLPERLDGAWRAAPSLLRLRRHLGTSQNQDELRRRVTEALGACPKTAHCQLGFLHFLQGNFNDAAALLAGASGSWSSFDGHPGYLLFPLFCRLFGKELPNDGESDEEFRKIAMLNGSIWDNDTQSEKPRLPNPTVIDIVHLSGLSSPPENSIREALIDAMRTAATKRISYIVKEKRRRHYAHAAALVVSVSAIDPSPITFDWAESIRREYRGLPALQREFERFEI
jgi:hypothetical protein